MAFIMAMSLMNQLQPRWEALCSLYSVREKPSKMYHWSTFVLSNVLAEIPYNIVGGTLFFIPWYFVIGFEKGMAHDHQNLRGFYEWLMIMLFQLWWSTFGQMIAAASPNAQTAAVLTTVTSSFVINFCGVLQPIFALIKFWHWMYYLSPYTWLIAGVMENSLGGIEVTCSAKELVSFNPPSGQTCLQYAGVFVEAAGKLINPSATAACQYCKYSSGDQYLATVNMRYSDRWRNLGFICAYIIFNIALTLLLFYLTKIANLNIGAKFMSKKKEKQQQHQDAKKSDKKSPRSLLPIAEPKPQVQDSSDDGAMETNVMGVRSEK
jgi:ABC-type multidrug transport system permease subunit